MNEPDPDVVRAAQNGDAGAFEHLVRRYQGEVWRLCLQLLRDKTLADDVTQEAFVRAYRFLPRYRGESKFSTWLFSISRNCAWDEMRRAGRRRRMRDRLEAERPRPPGDMSVGIEVRESLALLPFELREPVIFIDMFGCSYKEVAEILGLPVGTVKSRVHRGREQLAHRLAEPREETNELS
ncbi:MAG: sigma-70 family RNA polymerase sigma factor [Actinomycetota bacterium]|nr:sigma-70 family RNA polymerase sigma factor [Actinomycetota bacterium]